VKFDFNFLHQPHLTHCGFKTDELIGNPILPPWLTMIELRSD